MIKRFLLSRALIVALTFGAVISNADIINPPVSNYAPGAVAITGGTINNTTIGATTASTLRATTITATSTIGGTVITASTNLAGPLAGVTTNSNAAAGLVGQIIESTIPTGTAVSLTNATPANITSVSLTAGDWDCSINADYNLGSATTTVFQVGFGTTTATFTAQTGGAGIDTDPSNTDQSLNTSITGLTNELIGPVRISLASTTTIYAVAQATFSLGTVSVFGTERCRRIR